MFWCALPAVSEDRQKSGNGALGTLEFGSLQNARGRPTHSGNWDEFA